MHKKAIKYLISMVLFVIIMDKSIGFIYERLYFTEKSINHDRLIYSAIGTKEDVLVFGSSRAYHHYNPLIIEEELGLSCFNVGSGGQNIYFHLALLKEAIKRNKPKIAILDLIYVDFEDAGPKHDKEKLGVLLPFVNKSEIYKNAVFLRGSTEKIKLLSSIYPYNSKQLYMIRNNLSSQRSDTKGFYGLPREWNEPIKNDEIESFEIDVYKLKAIYEFIEICKKNDINIFIFISPHYAKNINKENYNYISENIHKKYGILVNNFTDSTKYLNIPHYFSDPFHLNKKGADFYSKEVYEYISKNLD